MGVMTAVVVTLTVVTGAEITVLLCLIGPIKTRREPARCDRCGGTG